jgi:hypothetical protein
VDKQKQHEQHRSDDYNMLKRNNMHGFVVREEDFQETPPNSSVSTFSSVKSDEKLNRYVLKIDILPSLQKSPTLSLTSPKTTTKIVAKSESSETNNISVMSINQVCNKSRVMMVPSSYEEDNLSDDQKLVLNITTNDDGTPSVTRKNVNRIMLSDNFSSCDDHLDSGTCSDAEMSVFQSSESPQPPPLPPKMGHNKTSRNNNQQVLSDSFYSDVSSASSSDSMQYNGSSIMTIGSNHLVSPDLIRSIEDHHHLNKSSLKNSKNNNNNESPLPLSLLMDIRSRSIKFNVNDDDDVDDDDDGEGDDEETTSDENDYNEMCNNKNINDKKKNISDDKMMIYSDDKSYKFHINEHLSGNLEDCHLMTHDESDENFAGYKDLHCRTATIRSAKGTIRGVKNRVRNGIKTFLLNSSTTVRVSSTAKTLQICNCITYIQW